MKKFFLLMLSLTLINTTFAEDLAQLKLHVTGPIKNNNIFFLCMYEIGCLSLHAGASGRSFPIVANRMANIKRIFIANLQAHHLYSQPLPPSCSVTLAAAQTLTIYGQLSVQPNGVSIHHLRCTLNNT